MNHGIAIALGLMLALTGCGGDQKSADERSEAAQKAIQEGMQKEKKLYEGMQKGVDSVEKQMEKKP